MKSRLMFQIGEKGAANIKYNIQIDSTLQFYLIIISFFVTDNLTSVQINIS
jgi:hypothetical protein